MFRRKKKKSTLKDKFGQTVSADSKDLSKSQSQGSNPSTEASIGASTNNKLDDPASEDSSNILRPSTAQSPNMPANSSSADGTNTNTNTLNADSATPVVKQRSRLSIFSKTTNSSEDKTTLKSNTSSNDSTGTNTGVGVGNAVSNSASKESTSIPLKTEVSNIFKRMTSSKAEEAPEITKQLTHTTHATQQTSQTMFSAETEKAKNNRKGKSPFKRSSSSSKKKNNASIKNSINLSSDSKATEYKAMEVNYDLNPTLLYKFIEYKEWTDALDRIQDAPEETKMWVYRLEDYNPDDENSITTFKDQNIRWRMLPIHVAVIFNAPIKVIMALYKANPLSITAQDDRKMMPVHLACKVVSNISVAQFLIYKGTNSLSAIDYKGRTPLEVLMEYRDKTSTDKKSMKNREALIQLIQEKLNVGGSKSRSKDVEVKDLSDDEDDDDLVNSSEEAMKELHKKEKGKNVTKSTRLQRTEPSTKKASDGSTKEVDYDSYPTVLIKLIERKMWEQAITRCVEVPQEASTWMCRLQEVKDKKEKKSDVRWKILPIHSAIVLHAPVEVIEALTEAYPEGLHMGDDRQMLPLHMAFRLGSSPETAAVLVDAYPEALKKKDSRGHTPLHILKAYRRKYIKEHGGKFTSSSEMDINRKKLIKFYLGGRKYGYGVNGDDRLRNFDSDSDSEYSSSDDESYYDSDDEDALFHKEMFADFAKLTSKGITSFPIIMRDTLACRGGSYDLGA